MTDRELFEFIDVEEFLIELGIRNVRDDNSGEVSFSCPFPGHSHLDSRPSASMTKVERESSGRTLPKTWFYCFTCGAKGSAVDFLAEYEGISPLVAKRFLRERFAKDYTESEGSIEEAVRAILEPKSTVPRDERVLTLPVEFLSRYEINWPEVYMAWEATQGVAVPEPLAYMLDRGFEPETLMDYNIGFDDEISQRITIPARDDEGRLLGFKGRAWWDDAFPKYMVLGGDDYGFPTYEVSKVLWGLDTAIPHLSDSYLIVREGELNALMLRQMGYQTAVGLSGKRVSGDQYGLIKKHSGSVIFWFDDVEDAFNAATPLMEIMPVSIVPATENDPADSTPEEVAEAMKEVRSALSLYVM